MRVMNRAIVVCTFARDAYFPSTMCVREGWSCSSAAAGCRDSIQSRDVLLSLVASSPLSCSATQWPGRELNPRHADFQSGSGGDVRVLRRGWGDSKTLEDTRRHSSNDEKCREVN